MPAIFSLAAGIVAGTVLGLAIPWSAWVLAPLAAAGALAHQRSARLAILGPALAAGVLWGAAARVARERDCRLRWPDDARLALMLEPADLSPPEPGSAGRYLVRAPSCGGVIIAVRLPPGAPLDTTLAVAGTWRRDPSFRDGPLPRPPERAGLLLVRRATPVVVAWSWRTRLRRGAERRLATLFGARRWPLAAALTVSPDAALPRDVRQRFARAGLAHILSISGLHVGLLAGSLIIILRATRLPPDTALASGTVLVAAYLWMLGFPAPALRSGALIGLYAWSRIRQRPPVPGALLAVTVVVVTLADPYALFAPGPWLSFAGVWGCGRAARWWERVVREGRSRRSRRRRRWVMPAMVSLGAVLATTPIQLLAFGTVTPVAILSNLAAIPIAAFATPALALSLVLALLPWSLPATLAASASGLGLDALEWVAARSAELPGATVTIESVGFAAVVAGLLAGWLLREGPRRHALRQLGARTVLGGAALAAVLACRPVLALPGTADDDGGLTLHFLAVGQGDAAAIRTPHGHWIVIDGGPRAAGLDEGARKVVPFLRRHGARALDLVVASHGDADHLGGLPAILAALPPALALEPGAALGRPLYIEWLAGLGRGGVRWHPARAGDVVVIDSVTVRVWHPDSATVAEGWEPNENSVVLTVEYGAFRALFGGDAGLPMEALRAPEVGAVTVLKVGHHGSRSATGEAWLAALRPAVCVIEVGARNRYGHPDPGTLARLVTDGCDVWRTDRDGDVAVHTDGRTVRVHAAARDTTFALGKEPS